MAAKKDPLAELNPLERAEYEKLLAERDNLQFDLMHKKSVEKWNQALRKERRVFDFVTDVNSATVQWAVDELSEWAWVSKDPITIRLNSPGGSVFDGLMLFDLVRQLSKEYKVPIITEVYGYAASMASVLSQAGTERRIKKNAWFMIHEPSHWVWGSLSELKDNAKLVERLHEQLCSLLAERSKLSAKEIMEKCDHRDWWLSAKEAYELGFFDKLF
jgi:ATP-dependent Clp endopeptidase proteolytic subunit ClpP